MSGVTTLSVAQPSSQLQFTPAQIDVLKRTVAKDATNDEFQMFLYLAQRYNLDPFMKEIWFWKGSDNKPVIMTSRDGYLKVAQESPEFDGIKAFVVREGDTFEIDTAGDSIVHKFGAKRGKIIGAWAAAYHKHRRPQICFVDFTEYTCSKPVWQKYPSAMIQKVAESFVLKRQFGINGLVTKEELGAEEPIDISDQVKVVENESQHQIKSEPEPLPTGERPAIHREWWESAEAQKAAIDSLKDVAAAAKVKLYPMMAELFPELQKLSQLTPDQVTAMMNRIDEITKSPTFDDIDLNSEPSPEQAGFPGVA